MRSRSLPKNFFAALLLAVVLVPLSGLRSQADALPAPVAAVGSNAAGMWATGTVTGIASFLVIYDLIRRTTCSGDGLRLGGPGFGQPIDPSANVLVPRRCP